MTSVGINLKGLDVFKWEGCRQFGSSIGEQERYAPSPLLSPEVCGGKGRPTLSTPELCLACRGSGRWQLSLRIRQEKERSEKIYLKRGVGYWSTTCSKGHTEEIWRVEMDDRLGPISLCGVGSWATLRNMFYIQVPAHVHSMHTGDWRQNFAKPALSHLVRVMYSDRS